MEQKLTLRPRARIIRTVGDRLISGPIAAIIELIKNSHDADASFVRISFFPPLKKGKGTIIVEDDGHGMSFEDIKDKWMEPATLDKKQRKKSPNGRNMLGSKGIGRFSAARLGNFLTLETVHLSGKKSKRFKTTVKDIDWDVFEKTEYLDEIEFTSQSEETNQKSGTKLTISSLRDEWTQKYIENLYLELRKMIAPDSSNNDNPFDIFLDLSECKESTTGWNGTDIVDEDTSWRVEPIPLLDACDYKVTGAFDINGHFSGSIEIKRGGLKPEKIELPAPKLTEPYEASCGEVVVSFYIFDRDKDAIMDMAKRANLGDTDYKKARTMLNDIAGVTIYRDDYRIRPYGDNENDWLNLDKQRVQTPTRIGHDQVSGYIIVDDEEKSGLTERSSREGFEDGPEFRRLKSLITNLFVKEINAKRSKFRKKIKSDKDGTEDSIKQAKVLANLSWVEEILENLPEKNKKSAKEKLAKKSAKLVRYIESIEEKHAILEAKVALGMIVSEVIHEGRTPIHFIKTETTRLIKWWSELFSDKNAKSEKVQETNLIVKGLYENAEKLKDLLDTLSPLSGIKRNKPTKFSPNKLVMDIFYIFRSRINANNIEDAVFNEEGIDEILGYKQDLQPAISNVIDNAIFWLENSETTNPYIHIHILKEGKNCVFKILNNGPAVPEQYVDNIFDIGFGLKENGSGLGLPIARETLSRGNGSIEYIDNSQGEVGFEIKFPLKV